MAEADHKFQINLRGIIDLLSNHLYSGPQVYLRELLQNAVDAIRARTDRDPDHQGLIQVEILGGTNPDESDALRSQSARRPTLMVQDNGIGLTEPEIHQFLATIGQSSKRDALGERTGDFIGQFGIGLLSGFVVSDEIVVLTRSARTSGPALEWRGRPDGTYRLRTLEADVAPGTRVFLTCKAGAEEFFEPERVAGLLGHYGGLLRFPIQLIEAGSTRQINDEPPPWRRRFAGSKQAHQAYLDYGRQVLELDAFDAIPLTSQAGQVEGIALVLPYAPNLASRPTHRVYLKSMLLSEQAEGLLPDWAFFVKCIVNAEDLRPTASREGFYEDQTLQEAREALGHALRDYLVQLADRDPQRLQRLIRLHDLSIKALAVQDDAFYRIFIDWLPFETSMGVMTLGEYRMTNRVVRYATNLDQFRQIARVAAAQNMCVINGAYVYNTELLDKLDRIFPGETTEVVDPTGLMQGFEDLDEAEWEEASWFVQEAERILEPSRCGIELKRFQPVELPALYSTSAEGDFHRSVEQAREVSNELWSGVLEDLAESTADAVHAYLCFNYDNPLVRRLVGLTDRKSTLLQRAVEMLYVQALLLGHHPLNAREMVLLNQGLLDLIEFGLGDLDDRSN